MKIIKKKRKKEHQSEREVREAREAAALNPGLAKREYRMWVISNYIIIVGVLFAMLLIAMLAGCSTTTQHKADRQHPRQIDTVTSAGIPLEVWLYDGNIYLFNTVTLDCMEMSKPNDYQP